VILLLPVVVFWPVLDYDFINRDDPTHILENPQIQGLTFENLKKILLSSADVSNYYIPLTFLSYGLDYFDRALKLGYRTGPGSSLAPGLAPTGRLP